ncbi:MAG: Nif3-like dinuclear metal center hexameric protein [Idiomarina sp.]|nr:Nif3-like dinuclear metal center hexameric protein [Idiomarina sp.]
MRRDDLLAELNRWLNVEQIQDYCPNGLQVEGRETVSHIVTGVTASQALIQQALDVGADTLLVHHGYFWKGEAQPITGMKKRRIETLLSANMNLIAYHLPLDTQADFGNNVELLKRLGAERLEPARTASPEGILMLGHYAKPLSGAELSERLESILQRDLVAAVVSDKPIQRIAVCTGGGQGFIEDALNAGADAFVTGEVSEQTVHVARECGIQFFAAGHHATERYGVKALGEQIAEQFGLRVTFIDVDNPA